ncbi:hypothetical protein HRR80_007794 [Exophiala dermatitidis]|uniref:Uncharacterized protein n=1 Tax=Exophiala dermatitidis TaxID=5970 RepID=A0AAN6EQJ4_EXODE|nr:hypothetical protein HRR80_007794 [Exophiala dermatitidis]
MNTWAHKADTASVSYLPSNGQIYNQGLKLCMGYRTTYQTRRNNNSAVQELSDDQSTMNERTVGGGVNIHIIPHNLMRGTALPVIVQCASTHHLACSAVAEIFSRLCMIAFWW